MSSEAKGISYKEYKMMKQLGQLGEQLRGDLAPTDGWDKTPRDLSEYSGSSRVDTVIPTGYIAMFDDLDTL